jgi:hypothetical protein
LSQRSRLERLLAWLRPAPRGAAAAASSTHRTRLLTDPQRFARAQALISAYYAVLCFFAVGNLYTWPEWLAATTLEPRWPVFWLRFVDLGVGIPSLLCFHLACGLLAVALPRYRWVRILVFVSLLELLAFRFSFGSINHGEHLGVLISFVLIFLPTGWQRFPGAKRSVRAATLLVFSGAQGLLMLTYTMSGLWKAGGVVEQLLRGQTSYLHPDGLATQIAAKILGNDASPLLAPWFLDHAWLGPPLMAATIYLELFALWAVVRPSLHRLWGLGLILFHVSTHLTMGVGFAQHSLWLALFLVFSPFQPETFSWRGLLAELPLFGHWLG